jgi:hypothetical protein
MHWRKTTGSDFKVGYLAAWAIGASVALATIVLLIAHAYV